MHAYTHTRIDNQLTVNNLHTCDQRRFTQFKHKHTHHTYSNQTLETEFMQQDNKNEQEKKNSKCCSTDVSGRIPHTYDIRVCVCVNEICWQRTQQHLRGGAMRTLDDRVPDNNIYLFSLDARRRWCKTTMNKVKIVRQ